MKNIMKKAWEIYRTLTGDHIAKLSMALRMAWQEVKKMAKEKIIMTNLPKLTGTEKQIAYANDIRNEYINRINNDNVDNTAPFPNMAFVVDSFIVKETKSLIDYMIDKKDENGKSIIRQVFPEKWRHEVSTINSAIYDTSLSNDTNAVSNLKNLMKPVIEFNLSNNADSKYWIDNYKHLLYKK